jgi:hypothetical protein
MAGLDSSAGDTSDSDNDVGLSASDVLSLADTSSDEDDGGVPNVALPGPVVRRVMAWVPVIDTATFNMPATKPFEGARQGPVIREGTPFHYFRRYIEPEAGTNLIDLLVQETNRYAQQHIEANLELAPKSRVRDWRDVNSAEMSAFLGLLMTMGVIRKPTLESIGAGEEGHRPGCTIPQPLRV